MSPHDREREYLAALEPELRRQSVREDYPRRTLSRSLVLLLGFLRVYVVVCIALVIVTFVRVKHR